MKRWKNQRPVRVQHVGHGYRPPLLTVQDDWRDETVVVVASGPSTELIDKRLLRGRKIVAVAHGYRALQGIHADALVIGGRAFYTYNLLADIDVDVIIAAQDYPSWEWLEQRDERIFYMNRAEKHGLTEDRTALAGSESSVMLAINYVVHRGVRRIVLLGCDGQPSSDGRRRVQTDQQDTRNARDRYDVQEKAMATQIEPLEKLGVEIINCSPRTALTIYPKAKLEDLL
jgi:hypothetical protein